MNAVKVLALLYVCSVFKQNFFDLNDSIATSLVA